MAIKMKNEKAIKNYQIDSSTKKIRNKTLKFKNLIPLFRQFIGQ